VSDDALEEIRAELDSLAERLNDAAYSSLRAQLHRSGKVAKDDPDFQREKILSRARNAIERASALVAQAERLAERGGSEDSPELFGD
jgi:DNA-binding ferritin-like protein